MLTLVLVESSCAIPQVEKLVSLQSASCVSHKSSAEISVTLKSSNFCLSGFSLWEKKKKEKLPDKQITPFYFKWLFQFGVWITFQHQLQWNRGFLVCFYWGSSSDKFSWVQYLWVKIGTNRIPVGFFELHVLAAIYLALHCMFCLILVIRWWNCALFLGLWHRWAVYSDSND